MRKIKAIAGRSVKCAPMSKIDLSYAMRTVPRYTSYPTAPHFHDGLSADTYVSWLEALGPSDTLSLYLHVPYCREICHYCGCHTKATRKEAPLVAYAKTLRQEIELVAAHLTSAGSVRHIHWGGGTPSLLPHTDLLQITQDLQDRFQFAADVEHAIELDPRNVTPALAETLQKMGVNRASLGVQDFDLTVQKAIGRVQPFDLVAKAVADLHAVGLTDLNFDLMYGLPEQTRETILDTITKTLELRPGRIALFGYAHVPWMRKHQTLMDETRLPDAAERLAMADLARTALQDAGYTAIRLDHFALPEDSMAQQLEAGDLRRNFQGYTTDQGDQLIGFGVSSIGKLSQGYIQNLPDVGGWRRKIEAGTSPIGKGLALSTDDLLRGRIIEQLMTDYQCDVEKTCGAFGVCTSSLSDCFDALSGLADDGLVRLSRSGDHGFRVEITEQGQPYVRLAAAAFDAYLGGSMTSGKARHSTAV
ncbi:oxygen-independent coproporphyrinogen III oxidase [Roseibium sp. TrichSKD4]|nr:oxygen-independent coproporphyrinogen III oxidase [Roseibium sp. TrichSKD4]